MKLPDTFVYNKLFYDSQVVNGPTSAAIVLGLFCETFRPRSAVDVGCGSGSWLKTLMSLGVTDIIGIDGPWAKNNPLIPDGKFIEADLSGPLPNLNRQFDVAISLEVAEHLPPERSQDFVNYLCGMAPVVLFSAAIPGQGGANHINERWQSDWAAMFGARGYIPEIGFRDRIWPLPDVEWWYRQNIVVYVDSKNGSNKKSVDLKSLDVVTRDYVGKYLWIINLINAVGELIPRRLKAIIAHRLMVK